MKRCFVALRIEADARRQLEAVGEALRALPPSAARKLRVVKPASLHVTIKFLGPTPDAQIPELSAVLAEVAASFGPTPGALEGLGAFPSAARPRIIWAGLGDGFERVRDLMSEVDEVCGLIGFERETRAPHPHVTVARVERPKPKGLLTTFIESWAERSFGAIDGSTLVLFESQLQRSGAVYAPLAELPLQVE